jgi:hypothetical protein
MPRLLYLQEEKPVAIVLKALSKHKGTAYIYRLKIHLYFCLSYIVCLLGHDQEYRKTSAVIFL